jgi:hypothetical protein
VEHTENFDTRYMQALFDYAYNQASHGYRWSKGHPLLLPPTRTAAR